MDYGSELAKAFLIVTRKRTGLIGPLRVPSGTMSAVILLIDDDEILPYVLQRGLARDGFDGDLRFASDGQMGIDYLSRKGEYADDDRFPYPSVVLLDLNMPGVNGFEVLSWKREQKDLAGLPVVVWSSSVLSEDKDRALALGAADYLFKPMNLDELLALIRKLADSHPKNRP